MKSNIVKWTLQVLALSMVASAMAVVCKKPKLIGAVSTDCPTSGAECYQTIYNPGRCDLVYRGTAYAYINNWIHNGTESITVNVKPATCSGNPGPNQCWATGDPSVSGYPQVVQFPKCVEQTATCY